MRSISHDNDKHQNKNNKDKDDRDDDNGIVLGTKPSFTLLAGISELDTVPAPVFFFDPPDNGLAVGAKYIVSTANAEIKWSDLAGNQVVEKSMASLFAPLGAYRDYFDDRVIYNAATGQFVASGIAEDAANNFHVVVALSKDANPNDGFNLKDYQFADKTALPDQPDVVMDNKTLFLQASIYPTAGGNLQHVLVFNGAASTEVDVTGGGVYKQIASLGTGDYLLAHDQGTLTLRHVNTSGVLTSSSTLNLGAISGNFGEQELATMGTAQPIDAGDERVYGLAMQGSTLWTTFEVTPTSGPDAGHANVHWAALNISDPAHMTLIGQGTVSGASLGVGVGTSTGSVAIDAAGDTIINFVATGPNMVPTDYFTIKAAGATSFSELIPYATSAGPFVAVGDPNFNNASRFGDYSSAVADPNNSHGFYVSNEIGVTANSGTWATKIAHVIAPSHIV